MKPGDSDSSGNTGKDDGATCRIFPVRSLSMCARFDSQSAASFSPRTRTDFRRSASLGRVGDVVPRRRTSVSLSRYGSSGAFEDLPSDVIAQAGDSGDRVVDDGEETGTASRRRHSSCSGRESWRKGSIRLSYDLEDGVLEDVGEALAAQAGDSGDRVATEDGYDGSDSLRVEQVGVTITENGAVPVEGDALLAAETTTSPLPTDGILYSGEKTASTFVVQSPQGSSFKQYKLPRSLDYIAYLVHLAVFGIFGVLVRYLLQKLFGPGRLALTSDETPLYLDLPANMAGSFFMGWFGLVFKGDVRHVSDHLAIGLTTGFMGSLTTFSGWNQKMLDLSSKDHWVFAVAGIILGLFIVNESFRYGAESAEWLRERLLNEFCESSDSLTFIPERWRIQRPCQHFTAMTTMLLMLGLLWGISGALARTRLDDVTDGAVLWLACVVGPPGVWLRWYLARYNGQGLGKKGSLKWLPLGTLTANILAALIMAALSTVNKAVNTRRCGIIIRGVQFGFLGCLSTVSTFVAEIYAMRQGGHAGKAFAYAVATFVPSFAVGTLIYSTPVWTEHYN